MHLTLILDKSGREVVQYTYDGWGNCRTTVIDEESAQIADALINLIIKKKEKEKIKKLVRRPV